MKGSQLHCSCSLPQRFFPPSAQDSCRRQLGTTLNGLRTRIRHARPHMHGAVVEAARHGGMPPVRHSTPGNAVAKRAVLAALGAIAVALDHFSVPDDGKALLHAGCEQHAAIHWVPSDAPDATAARYFRATHGRAQLPHIPEADSVVVAPCVRSCVRGKPAKKLTTKRPPVATSSGRCGFTSIAHTPA